MAYRQLNDIFSREAFLLLLEFEAFRSFFIFSSSIYSIIIPFGYPEVQHHHCFYHASLTNQQFWMYQVITSSRNQGGPARLSVSSRFRANPMTHLHRFRIRSKDVPIDHQSISIHNPISILAGPVSLLDSRLTYSVQVPGANPYCRHVAAGCISSFICPLSLFTLRIPLFPLEGWFDHASSPLRYRLWPLACLRFGIRSITSFLVTLFAIYVVVYLTVSLRINWNTNLFVYVWTMRGRITVCSGWWRSANGSTHIKKIEPPWVAFWPLTRVYNNAWNILEQSSALVKDFLCVLRMRRSFCQLQPTPKYFRTWAIKTKRLLNSTRNLLTILGTSLTDNSGLQGRTSSTLETHPHLQYYRARLLHKRSI